MQIPLAAHQIEQIVANSLSTWSERAYAHVFNGNKSLAESEREKEKKKKEKEKEKKNKITSLKTHLSMLRWPVKSLIQSLVNDQ